MAAMEDITARASEFVFSLFKQKLPEHLVYHNYAHTQFVVAAARKIAKGMKLADEGVEVIELAAWLHDTGFTEIYRGHESVSMRIAREFLEYENYPEDRIKLVEGCIAATRVPQQPHNLLEEILCDADMSSAGRKSYFDRLGLLRIEWERALGEMYSDDEWDKLNLDFLTSHKYFTRFAQDEYESQKQENIRILDRQIRKRSEPGDATRAKMPMEEQLPSQTEKTTYPDLGFEAMFTLLWQNQMALLTQTGHKAQMLVLTNTLILPLLLGFVIPRIARNPNLALPSFTALVVCLLTIIFAVLAARPQKGTFNYEWDEIFRDRESLMRDTYNFGRVISKKCDYLRWSYNIFMYGLLISIVLLALVYLFPIWDLPRPIAP